MFSVCDLFTALAMNLSCRSLWNRKKSEFFRLPLCYFWLFFKVWLLPFTCGTFSYSSIRSRNSIILWFGLMSRLSPRTCTFFELILNESAVILSMLTSSPCMLRYISRSGSLKSFR